MYECTSAYARILVPATVHPGTPESTMHHPNEPGIACRSVLRIYNPPDAGELLMSRARDICLYAKRSRRIHGRRTSFCGWLPSSRERTEQVGTPTTNFSHLRFAWRVASKRESLSRTVLRAGNIKSYFKSCLLLERFFLRRSEIFIGSGRFH